jgi:hypothetical protein
MTLSSLFQPDAPEGDGGDASLARSAPAAAASLERSMAALLERQHEDG